MKHSQSIALEWKQMDVENKGKITFDQFKRGLKKVRRNMNKLKIKHE